MECYSERILNIGQYFVAYFFDFAVDLYMYVLVIMLNKKKTRLLQNISFQSIVSK